MLQHVGRALAWQFVSDMYIITLEFLQGLFSHTLKYLCNNDEFENGECSALPSADQLLFRILLLYDTNRCIECRN